jgi:hypothetical protein
VQCLGPHRAAEPVLTVLVSAWKVRSMPSRSAEPPLAPDFGHQQVAPMGENRFRVLHSVAHKKNGESSKPGCMLNPAIRETPK